MENAKSLSSSSFAELVRCLFFIGGSFCVSSSFFGVRFVLRLSRVVSREIL